MKKDDPRNIFCNQREEFVQNEQQPYSKHKDSEQPNTQEKTYEQRLEEMKQLAAKYEKEGEGQLVKDIVNNVLEQKAAGNLTNEQLLLFAKRVSPLLNSEQRQRLNELLEQLLKL